MITATMTINWHPGDRFPWVLPLQIPITDVGILFDAAHTFAALAESVEITFDLPPEYVLVPSIVTYRVEFDHGE